MKPQQAFRLEEPAAATVRSALDCIITMDVGGRVLAWNPAAERTFGYREEEALGRETAELIVPVRLRSAHRNALARYAATHEARILDRRIETTGLRADGAEFPVELAVTRVDDGLGVPVFTAHLRDITERVRTEQALALREAEERSLHRVCLAVARDAEPEDIFDLVADEVAELLGASAGWVMRFDGGREAVVVGSSGSPGLPLPGTVPLQGRTVSGLVSRDRRPSRVADYREHGDSGSRTLAALGYRSSVGAPIAVGSRLWGAVIAADTQVGRFQAEDEERLARFSEPLALAVANADVGERIVSDTAVTIFAGQLQMEPTLRAIAAAARRALRAHRATCYLISPDGVTCEGVYTTESEPVMRRHLESGANRPLRDFPVWALLLDQPDGVLALDDVGEVRGARTAARSVGTEALIGVRLEHASLRDMGIGGPMLGGLFVSFDEPRAFSTRDRAAARSLGSMASIAVANARLHSRTLRNLEEARERAALDSLTGLVNHRTFQERLTGEVARALRHGRPLALALFDLDHFKRVNDLHGHQTGDDVLVEIAQRLQAASRPGDTVARIGGEEFAWLLPETDAARAYLAAERGRQTIASQPIGGAGVVTVSAGLCDLAEAGSADELLRKADGALYWAKIHGRDVTYRFSPEVVEVLSAEERADRLQRVGALSAMRALARAVDAKDPSTQSHSERVAHAVERLALAAGWSTQQAALLREAALVHDVGKIGVPDAILLKPMRLTPREYEAVKEHASLGADIAAELLSAEQVAWIRHHHERWDGDGYPSRLPGPQIPVGARLLAVADAWDAMTGPRPYQSAMTPEEALEECRASTGSHLCPDAAGALERCWTELAEVRADAPRRAAAEG